MSDPSERQPRGPLQPPRLGAAPGDEPRQDSGYADAVVVGGFFWFDHLDALIEGLRQAPLKSTDDPPEPPLRWGDISITDPHWWADHPDELGKAFREAVESLFER
jgi:hypothetical protein